MKIRAKLSGTLSRSFPGYRYSEGLEVEVPDRGTVKDLLALLQITDFKRAVVIREGYILKLGDVLKENNSVVVFEALHGG